MRMWARLVRTLTFLMMSLFWSSRNLTLTCVTWPRAPVRPMTFITIASLIGVSCAGDEGDARSKRDKTRARGRAFVSTLRPS